MEINFEEHLKDISKLQEYIDKQATKLFESKPEEKYRSEEINELAVAFAKAQGDYPTIRYNRETSMFQNEYTDLDLIMKLIRPILSRNGLSFLQQTKFDKDGVTLLDSILLHSSGQWIKSQTRIIPSKEDKLVKISELNTEKRLQAQTLLNVTVMDDLLDDNSEKANEEFEQKQKEGTDLNYNYNPKTTALRISKDQLQDVQYELKNYPDVAKHLLERLKIETFADMPKEHYRQVMNYIHDTVKLRTERKEK